MIQIEQITSYFPATVRENSANYKHMLKEYLELQILDFLSTTVYVKKMTFIGGTNLRLAMGIDRFSEDLDFDCKGFSEEEFMEMSDAVLQFLTRAGWKIAVKDKPNPRLKAFRRNIHFPELLFDLGLSGHREARFLLKVEGQDQGIAYQPEVVNITGCGFFFPFPVPPEGVLCSMKIAAMLARAKGRDFYDLMFLLGRTRPNYDFLAERCGIANLEAFKKATQEKLQVVDLNSKKQDFEHLLFTRESSEKILRFGAFIDALK